MSQELSIVGLLPNQNPQYIQCISNEGIHDDYKANHKGVSDDLLSGIPPHHVVVHYYSDTDSNIQKKLQGGSGDENLYIGSASPRFLLDGKGEKFVDGGGVETSDIRVKFLGVSEEGRPSLGPEGYGESRIAVKFQGIVDLYIDPKNLESLKDTDKIKVGDYLQVMPLCVPDFTNTYNRNQNNFKSHPIIKFEYNDMKNAPDKYRYEGVIGTLINFRSDNCIRVLLKKPPLHFFEEYTHKIEMNATFGDMSVPEPVRADTSVKVAPRLFDDEPGFRDDDPSGELEESHAVRELTPGTTQSGNNTPVHKDATSNDMSESHDVREPTPGVEVPVSRDDTADPQQTSNDMLASHDVRELTPGVADIQTTEMDALDEPQTGPSERKRKTKRKKDKQTERMEVAVYDKNNKKIKHTTL